jgi:hypothetical protein
MIAFYINKERDVIEIMFGKIKHFMWMATRYNKPTIFFMAFLRLAAVLFWLK